MPTMNISLTDELLKLVQDRVSSGMYNNASEVIREAIRQLETTDSLVYELKLKHLKEALSEGIEQSRNKQFVDQGFDDIISEAKRELDVL